MAGPIGPQGVPGPRGPAGALYANGTNGDFVVNGDLTVGGYVNFSSAMITELKKMLLNIEQPEWYKNCTMMQIYPQSFKATNKSSFYGSLKGIQAKINYIKSLNVNVVFLNPFWESPLYDAGYDVSDYFYPDSRYSTENTKRNALSELKELIDAFHTNDIKVCADFVVNHTSHQHKFFQDSMDDPTGPHGNFYRWNNGLKDSNDNRIYTIATRRIVDDAATGYGDDVKNYYDVFKRIDNHFLHFIKTGPTTFEQVDGTGITINACSKKGTTGDVYSITDISGITVESIVSKNGLPVSGQDVGVIGYLVPCPTDETNGPFAGEAWTYNNTCDKLYYHFFTAYQPELNYTSGDVINYAKTICTYYLGPTYQSVVDDYGVTVSCLGLDGIRLDAADQLTAEDGGNVNAKNAAIIALLSESVNFPNKAFIAETFAPLDFGGGQASWVGTPHSTYNSSNAGVISMYKNKTAIDLSTMQRAMYLGKHTFDRFIQAQKDFLSDPSIKINPDFMPLCQMSNHDHSRRMNTLNPYGAPSGPYGSPNSPTKALFLDDVRGLYGMDDATRLANMDLISRLDVMRQCFTRASFHLYAGDEIMMYSSPVHNNHRVKISSVVDSSRFTNSAIWDHTNQFVKHETFNFVGCRDHLRIPIPWSNTAFGGFFDDMDGSGNELVTTVNPNVTVDNSGNFTGLETVSWLPPSVDLSINVKDQDADPESNLNFYRKMLGIRNSKGVFGTVSDIEVIYKDEPHLQGYMRTIGTTRYVFLCNNMAGDIKIIGDYEIPSSEPEDTTSDAWDLWNFFINPANDFETYPVVNSIFSFIPPFSASYRNTLVNPTESITKDISEYLPLGGQVLLKNTSVVIPTNEQYVLPVAGIVNITLAPFEAVLITGRI